MAANRILERVPPTWGGRPLDSLNAAELEEASAFVDRIVAQFQEHAPPFIWSYFAALRSDLTIERAKRMIGSKRNVA